MPYPNRFFFGAGVSTAGKDISSAIDATCFVYDRAVACKQAANQLQHDELENQHGIWPSFWAGTNAVQRRVASRRLPGYDFEVGRRGVVARDGDGNGSRLSDPVMMVANKDRLRAIHFSFRLTFSSCRSSLRGARPVGQHL